MQAQDAIREIEAFHARFVRENALYRLAEAGRIDAPILQEYLVSVQLMTASTIPTLRRGITIARFRGDDALAGYFETKIKEEVGHDAWAIEDQAALAKAFRLQVAKHPGSGVRAHVDAQFKIVEEDPYLYLAYMLFAEYFTVLAVPGWVDLLATRCALPPEYVTVLTKHAELDKGHVAECVQEIDVLMADYPRPERFFKHLRDSFGLYEDFCNEVAETGHGRREKKSA